MIPNQIDTEWLLAAAAAAAAAGAIVAYSIARRFPSKGPSLEGLCENVSLQIDDSLRLVARNCHEEAISNLRRSFEENLGPLGSIILARNCSKLGCLARAFYSDASWHRGDGLQPPRRLQVKFCKRDSCNCPGVGRGPHKIIFKGTVPDVPVQDVITLRPIPVTSIPDKIHDITVKEKRKFQETFGNATVLVDVVIDEIAESRKIICDCVDGSLTDIGRPGEWVNYVREREAKPEEWRKWAETTIRQVREVWDSRAIAAELESIRDHLRKPRPTLPTTSPGSW